MRRILEEQRRGILFSHVIGANDLLDALLDEPEIAGLLAEAQLDRAELETTIEEASTIAVQRKHIAVRVEHILRVIVEQRWFGSAVHHIGGDIDVLRSDLDARLDSFATRASRAEIFPTKALALLIERATAYGKKHFGHTTSDVFIIFALQDSEASDVFAGAEIARLELLSTLVHGPDSAVSSGHDTTEEGLAEVVFHNDDFSTQELVVHLLTTTFELTKDRAQQVMLSVHTNGEACVATYPVTTARLRAEAAREVAHRAGFPLKITMRRV